MRVIDLCLPGNELIEVVTFAKISRKSSNFDPPLG